MFGFLAPLALFGLGLLAIPIVLHIFKPRKVREIPFSSLRWLRASQHRMSKKIRWHQVLLLLLRAGFITALVVALASPVISSREGTQWTDRFVVLDVSRGMGYEDVDGSTPLQRGKAITERLIEHVSPGDRTAVLRVGTHVRAFGPMAPDAGEHLSALNATELEPGGANLTDVLRLIKPMREAGEHRGESIELFFITDNASHKWSQGDINRFTAEATEQADVPVQVNIIDVSPETVETVWIAHARLIERQSSEQRLLRVEIGAAGQEPQTRTLRLTGLDGLQAQERPLTLEPGNFTRVEFELPEGFDLSGQVARLDLDPDVGLPGDSTHWVNLDATTATRVLLIEPALTEVAELQPGHHLRTALRTLNQESHGRIEVVRREPTAVLADEIARADAIVMVEVPELAEGDVQALEQRVQQGAGLAVFLGPSINLDFYNNQLHEPLRPVSSLLPVQLGSPVQERDVSRLSRVDSDHAMFRGLSDPLYGDLDRTQFTSYFQLETVDAVRDARALAYIGNSQPAILERPFGSGRVLLFNTSANDAWTDLPRRRSYVPLVDRLVRQLAGGLHQGTFTVGSAATVQLPAHLSEPSVEVVTPGGERFTPDVQEVRGRSVIRFETLDEVGVYQVTARGAEGVETFPFVVQTDAADSAAKRVDAETLQAWWEPAEVNVIRPDSAGDVLGGADARWLLTSWLLVLACVLLAAEMFFVHWLCPRAHAPLSEAVVNRHGFFHQGVSRTPEPARRAGGNEGAAPAPAMNVSGGSEPVASGATA